MAELTVGAPLAGAEDEDDWGDFPEDATNTEQINGHSESDIDHGKVPSIDFSFMDSFLERGDSGSLENLVNTFDKTLSECFCGTSVKDVSKIAPQQVRSQEEIVNDCP